MNKIIECIPPSGIINPNSKMNITLSYKYDKNIRITLSTKIEVIY
jgi:hypothetical protein